LDIAGGSLVDASMVVALSRVYRLDFSARLAAALVGSIAAAAGLVTAAQLATHLGASLLKGVTVGMSTLLTAPVQAAAAGYGSYIVGKASQYYLENGASWAGRSPKQVIQAIIETTDRQSVIDRLKGEIRARLATNRYADRSETGAPG